jgi:hypothetical protein
MNKSHTRGSMMTDRGKVGHGPHWFILGLFFIIIVWVKALCISNNESIPEQEFQSSNPEILHHLLTRLWINEFLFSTLNHNCVLITLTKNKWRNWCDYWGRMPRPGHHSSSHPNSFGRSISCLFTSHHTSHTICFLQVHANGDIWQMMKMLYVQYWGL